MAFTENLDAFPAPATLPSSARWARRRSTASWSRPMSRRWTWVAPARAFYMKYSSVSAATNGLAITVGGSSYIIRSVAPDGTGMAAVTLELAA